MPTPELSPPECLHQIIYTRVLTPELRTQELRTPECLHQNVYTRIFTSQCLRQSSVHQSDYTITQYTTMFTPEPQKWKINNTHTPTTNTQICIKATTPSYRHYQHINGDIDTTGSVNLYTKLQSWLLCIFADTLHAILHKRTIQGACNHVSNLRSRLLFAYTTFEFFMFQFLVLRNGQYVI